MRDANFAESSETSSHVEDEDTSYVILSPFAEVNFQGNSKRTMTMSGVDPLFNEQVGIQKNEQANSFLKVGLLHFLYNSAITRHGA